MRLLQVIRKMRRAPDTLIEIRIHREALLNNYHLFKTTYQIPVAPVLKSNAYGHGLLEVAAIVAPLSPLLVIDSLYEAALLRSNGIRTPLLVIGYTRPESIARARLRDVSFTITSLDGLKAFVEYGAAIRVHIKLDTGMRRQGIMPNESAEAIRILKASTLVMEGICSHFADADGAEDFFTRAQITLWNTLVPQWREAFSSIRYWHLAATAGAAYLKEANTNLMRLGTGLYGFPRHASQIFALTPALSLHSVITGVKDLAVGEKIGYNGIFTAEKPMRIATVPVGYYEGVDRRLSNKGSMLIGGVVCPIVGRVSMNITTIDVSRCPDVRLETAVVVFSDNSNDPNSLVSLAAVCGTTPLELLVHIPQHLRRVVV
jgi:alanine racemase